MWKEFYNKKQNTYFCSRECYNTFKDKNSLITHKERNLIKVKCAECGKEEWVTPSRAKKYLCCSRECLGKYNSKKYSKKVTIVCPICGKEYKCKQSKINHHRTCGNKECRTEWLKRTKTGKNNGNYKSYADDLKKLSVSTSDKYIYQHIVKEILGLNNTKEIPKGYVIHHKDGNHNNNVPENLIVIPKKEHRMIHTIFGNILINALHTNKISREVFINLCNKEQWNFYRNFIDLNVTHQVVVKQGELLESLEEGNQQPSIYRNIFEGSTTNGRVLTDNAEDGNSDTSALL